MSRAPALLLNLAHALDHLFLLVFATAVGAIALDFRIAHWEDLMPYTTGAFVMFGFASLPAGRLGDLWGRRRMMLIFFFGLGLSAFGVALARSPLEIGVALTVMGLFTAIYHPVGIPMLLEFTRQPGLTIGINGLVGNLGIAVAAVSTGLLVDAFGWRWAFVVPGVVCLLTGVAFAILAPQESAAPGMRKVQHRALPRPLVVRILVIMVLTATTGSLIFNFTTNGNGQLLAQRLNGIVGDPARLGMLLAGVYTAASFAQLIVGRLIDRVPMRPLFLAIAIAQVLVFAVAAQASGWTWYVLAIVYMMVVFAAIPFSDAIVARYIDDSIRSRVSGLRLTISFGISSIAVWALGPIVKAAGFTVLLAAMAGVAALTALTVLWLPSAAQLSDGERSAVAGRHAGGIRVDAART